jgi:hypothetical protein
MYGRLLFFFCLDVNISAILDDKFHHIGVVNCCGNVEWRTTKLILMIYIGTCLRQNGELIRSILNISFSISSNTHGQVVQSWISANPWLRFNLLF